MAASRASRAQQFADLNWDQSAGAAARATIAAHGWVSDRLLKRDAGVQNGSKSKVG
jgi:hypothetical protein